MSDPYHDLLVTLPLPEDRSDILLERAEALARAYQARLHLLLVLEPLPVAGSEFSPFDIDWSLEEHRFQSAERTLHTLRERLRLPASQASLRWGPLGLALQEHLQGRTFDLVLLPHTAPSGLGPDRDRIAFALPCDTLLIQTL